jgi:dCMP deaminase
MTPPRAVPQWDEFYLGLAYMVASRSKDPSTQCGAVIVDPHNIPLSFGCNGAARVIKDEDIDWGRPSKYPFMLHCEDNAINHCSRWIGVNGLDGCTVYVTGHPCAKCMNRMAGKGISRIVYGPLTINMVTTDEERTSDLIAQKAGISVEKFPGTLKWMLDKIKFMDGLGLFQDNVWAELEA